MTGLTTWLLMELTYLHALPPDLSTVSQWQDFYVLPKTLR